MSLSLASNLDLARQGTNENTTKKDEARQNNSPNILSPTSVLLNPQVMPLQFMEFTSASYPKSNQAIKSFTFLAAMGIVNLVVYIYQDRLLHLLGYDQDLASKKREDEKMIIFKKDIKTTSCGNQKQ